MLRILLVFLLSGCYDERLDQIEADIKAVRQAACVANYQPRLGDITNGGTLYLYSTPADIRYEFPKGEWSVRVGNQLGIVSDSKKGLLEKILSARDYSVVNCYAE